MLTVILNVTEIAADILASLLAERTAADEAHVKKKPKLDSNSRANDLLDRMIGKCIDVLAV